MRRCESTLEYLFLSLSENQYFSREPEKYCQKLILPEKTGLVLEGVTENTFSFSERFSKIPNLK